MILIGLIKSEAHVSGTSSFGYESHNISATKTEILKEGDKEELILFVESEREKATEGRKILRELDELSEEHEWNDFADFPYTSDEQNALENKADDLKWISKYDKLIIIEGFSI